MAPLAPLAPGRGWACILGLLLAGVPLASHATLGETEASVQANALRWGGTLGRQALSQAQATGPSAAGVQVITLNQPDGSTIRQYLNRDGRVFAVAWNTRYKPRLDELLGTHHDHYAQAARRARQAAPGVHHQALLQSGDLAVSSQMHVQSHVGRAWLRSLTPPQWGADVMR